MKELSILLDKDLITKEEFEKQKYHLLKMEGWTYQLLHILSLASRIFTPQIVILIIIFLFYSPLSRLIESASEIAFGDSFSFKVQEALRVQDPELANIVKELSTGEIAALISADSYVSLNSRLNRDFGERQEIGVDEKLEFYMGLQEKGLFYSSVELRKVKEIIEPKAASTEYDSSSSLYGPLIRKYYFEDDFSNEELAVVTKAGGNLTNAGEKVYWLIIDNAAADLAKVR